MFLEKGWIEREKLWSKATNMSTSAGHLDPHDPVVERTKE
jgi:hypothetical protein